MRHWPDLTIPADVAEKIPPYAGDKNANHEGDILWARFHDPQSRSEWFVSEFDGTDKCFGLLKVINLPIQFGDFSLSELSNRVNNVGLGIQYDPAFQPRTALQALKEINSKPW